MPSMPVLGGVPIGCVSELVGAVSSGRTTIALSLLATINGSYGRQRLNAVYPDGAGIGIRDLVTGIRYRSPDVLQKRAPSWNSRSTRSSPLMWPPLMTTDGPMA